MKKSRKNELAETQSPFSSPKTGGVHKAAAEGHGDGDGGEWSREMQDALSAVREMGKNSMRRGGA